LKQKRLKNQTRVGLALVASNKRQKMPLASATTAQCRTKIADASERIGEMNAARQAGEANEETSV
jgi:hypothetical protein